MDDRRVGDGEDSLPKEFSELNRFGVPGSRPCQNSRGDESPMDAVKGDDWNGDESMLRLSFCRQY